MSSYVAIAQRWSGGWELHIEGEGVTQVEGDLDGAEEQVRNYLASVHGRNFSDAVVVIRRVAIHGTADDFLEHLDALDGRPEQPCQGPPVDHPRDHQAADRPPGATAVSYLAGSKSSTQAHRWAKPDAPEPPQPAWERLLTAHRIWMAIATTESDGVARNWFIAANPRLDEETPLSAIRNGDLRLVLAAAEAFLDGTDG